MRPKTTREVPQAAVRSYPGRRREVPQGAARSRRTVDESSAGDARGRAQAPSRTPPPSQSFMEPRRGSRVGMSTATSTSTSTKRLRGMVVGPAHPRSSTRSAAIALARIRTAVEKHIIVRPGAGEGFKQAQVASHQLGTESNPRRGEDRPRGVPPAASV